MNIEKRVFGLVAAIGLIGGMFSATAPAANAVTAGGCSGIQMISASNPPLPSGGALTPITLRSNWRTTQGTTRATVWGAGFSFSETTTTGATCTFGADTFTSVKVQLRLTGDSSCDAAGHVAPTAPLSGTLDFYKSNPNNPVRKMRAARLARASIQISGFNDLVGPDVVTISGAMTRGPLTGATVSGDFFFDPVLQAAVNDDPVALSQGAQSGQVLRKQYFFDNSQIALLCGAGGNPVQRFYTGDGLSMLGSLASGLTFDSSS
jgi:hypothetical protein